LTLLVENLFFPESLGEIFSNPREDYQMAYKLKTTSEMEKKLSSHAADEVVDIWTGS